MGWFRDLGKDKPWAQGCIIAIAGGVLLVSGCFGFVAALNDGGPVAEVLGFALGGLALLGLLGLPVGGVWWLAGLLRPTLRKTPPNSPETPPAGPAPPQE